MPDTRLTQFIVILGTNSDSATVAITLPQETFDTVFYDYTPPDAASAAARDELLAQIARMDEKRKRGQISDSEILGLFMQVRKLEEDALATLGLGDGTVQPKTTTT